MNIVGKLSIVFCLLLPLKIFSQNFSEFDSLKQKAYAAYDKKDYASCLSYFEKIIQLPQIKKPEIDFYYDIACTYSLNKKEEQALTFLEKSFEISNAKQKTNPVSVMHIAQDSDLDFIRTRPRFLYLLKKFYSDKDIAAIESMSVKEISYSDLLKLIKLLSERNEKWVTISDKVIYWKTLGDSINFNEGSLPIPNFPELQTKPIVFKNCSFKLNFIWFGESEVNKQDIPLAGLEFQDCRFYGRFWISSFKIKSTINNQFLFKNCTFDKTFTSYIDLELGPLPNPNGFDGCTFRQFASIEFSSATPLRLGIVDNSVLNLMHIRGVSGSFVMIRDNKFSGTFQLGFDDVKTLKINNNKFKNLLFFRSNISTEFDFLQNQLVGELVLSGTYLPETTSSDIDWRVLNNFHIGLGGLDNGTSTSFNSEKGRFSRIDAVDTTQFLTGKNEKEISSDETFRELMGLYSVFLNVYKNKNDIESYNSCFIMIKELQSKRLKYLYESNPSFEKYFSWKLSQLLKFYVRYGTNPARAIVISVYIIICFGIFFFFFPSDWDTTSKSKLVQNFKDFIQKNEKGYVKPFFILLGGFIISLINAVTLSLNAFITLGFGNIPTHGIARYFCVLEGFLGWFLLSIFTVAMINQVL